MNPEPAVAAHPTICDCIDSLECKGIAECRFKATHIPESIRKTSAEPAARAGGTPEYDAIVTTEMRDAGARIIDKFSSGDYDAFFIAEQVFLAMFPTTMCARENEELRRDGPVIESGVNAQIADGVLTAQEQRKITMRQALDEALQCAGVEADHADKAEAELAKLRAAQVEAAKGLPPQRCGMNDDETELRQSAIALLAAKDAENDALRVDVERYIELISFSRTDGNPTVCYFDGERFRSWNTKFPQQSISDAIDAARAEQGKVE